MIVADTNLIAYLLIEGEFTQHARAAYLKDPLWAAPLLWRSEFRNILARYLRMKELKPAQASKLMAQAEQLLAGREHLLGSAQIFELVAGSNCSAYDCEFVALGRQLNVPLVTSDKRLLHEFPAETLSLGEFISLT